MPDACEGTEISRSCIIPRKCILACVSYVLECYQFTKEVTNLGGSFLMGIDFVGCAEKWLKTSEEVLCDV